MPRNDRIDRVSVRNVNLTATQISNTQRHNEREKESYVNPDIMPERTKLNVHFKQPTDNYSAIFKQMKEDKTISTRGLKADAHLFGELIFDVNSAYFHNHGGYEFAKDFYKDAYKAAINIVGGEQYILSAVMHADERNSAMSEALDQDVYHYHLHVVYIPVVEKQILWTKRCKDKSLVGTVKETITQVSSSKKWQSHPALDENGQPILQKNGKPVLRKSYSILQDDFFNAMRAAGYKDIERGKRGSSEEHLTVTQFKVAREQERLKVLDGQIERKTETLHKIEHKTKAQKAIAASFADIDSMGKKNLLSKIELSQQEVSQLKQLAKNDLLAESKVKDLQRDLQTAKRDSAIWKKRYTELQEQTKDFIAARRKSPKLAQELLNNLLNHIPPVYPEEPKQHYRQPEI